MNPQRYPLYWPDDWKRTPSYQRKNGQFKKYDSRASIGEGVNRVLGELARLSVKGDDILVSTNCELRIDGMPRGDREPADPGVAVYWRKKQGAPMQCIAVDIYTKVADNLCAVAATLEAMRAIERHGGAQVQERAYRGFAALSDGRKPWRDVLGIQKTTVSRIDIEDAFRALVKIHHPDAGGDTARFQEIAAARDEALREVAA